MELNCARSRRRSEENLIRFFFMFAILPDSVSRRLARKMFYARLTVPIFQEAKAIDEVRRSSKRKLWCWVEQLLLVTCFTDYPDLHSRRFFLFSHLSHTFCNFFPASPQTPTLDKCKFSRFEPQIFVLEISISNEYIFFAFVPSLPMTEWWIVNCISITWVCERGIPRSVKGNRRFHKRS